MYNILIMVKLIKLNSQIPTDTNELALKSRFTSYFQEDIPIKPNAKIALRNVQFSLENYDSIDSNMGLYVSLQKNIDGSLNNKQVLLDKADYEENGLADEVYLKVNSAFLQTDCPLIRPFIYNRVMFQTSYSSTNQFELSFKFTEDNYNTSLTTSTNISYDDTTQTYSKTGNDGEWDWISSGNTPISLGTGTAKCISSNPSGFFIGVHDSADKDNLTFNDILFKIFTDNTSLFYQYQVGSQPPVITNIIVGTNDYCEIGIQEGEFQFLLKRADNTVVITNIAKTINYVSEPTETIQERFINQYYCYFGLKYLTSNIRDIVWTPNPFYSSNETGIYKLTSVPHVVQSSLSDAVPSTVNLSFFGENSGGELMYQILGFNKTAYEITGVSGTFQGERKTTSNALPDGFYITIDNMKLNSYDYNELNVSGRRKNILANITNFDFIDTYNIVKYETDYPIYIDLDNKEPFLLNSLTISIYDQDNNLLNLGVPDTDLVIAGSHIIKMTLLIDG
jgi:hypothetical protein